MDENLRSSRSDWGVRLPNDFKAHSLKLLQQPDAKSKAGKQHERKALVLLSSLPRFMGSVDFLAFQLQAVHSVARTQSSESYQEHHPFSVLSRQCSGGQVQCPLDGSSIASVFLASASFQFDLRLRTNRSSNGAQQESNQIVGALGVIRTPGCGVEAITLTSSGPSRSTTILGKSEGNVSLLDSNDEMKSNEISSYWLSDIMLAQHSISPNFGGQAVMDFFVWTFQIGNGKVFCWFVPCLVFPTTKTSVRILIFEEFGSHEKMFAKVLPLHHSSRERIQLQVFSPAA